MDSGIFGLAAFGFWMFIAAATVGGIWDGIRKRDAEHETLRRIIESGKQPDQQLMDKLLGYNKAPERDLKVAGLIVLFVAPGLAVMGWLIGDDADHAAPWRRNARGIRRPRAADCCALHEEGSRGRFSE